MVSLVGRGGAFPSTPLLSTRAPRYGSVSMKIHPLISDSAALAALVERMSSAPFVAVDTENPPGRGLGTCAAVLHDAMDAEGWLALLRRRDD